MHADRHARGGTGAPSAPGGVPGQSLTGRVLEGRYRIGDRIARGGMASVYEATDLRLDRTVAIKVMHPGLGDDEEFAARFVREARAAARLSHPNVVAVYDQGEEDGVVFLAMELISGHTLRDVIRKESPMSPARALAILEPVVSALAAAHRAGLIHRDVKPENVLIADDGRIKVADFGLAKAVSADTQHTATGGVLIGTVSYLAPELVVDGRADPRSDVYAVGVVLHEMLTGAKPHEGESPIQVAWKHVHEDVPPPSTRVPGIPPYVDALVARATARDRDQRPADAGVLLHQLHRVAHALADGVRDDPDLTADLAPLPVPSPGLGTGTAEIARDTSPETWDAEEMAALMAPVVSPAEAAALAGAGEHHERTTLDPLGGHGGTAGPAQPGPRRGGSTAAAPSRPRRSRRGPLLLVLALLLAAAVGTGAWWFGWARYTSMPSVLELPQAAATEELEAAGFEVELGSPVHHDEIRAGRVVSTDPEPGSRVLEGGTVTLVVSLGREMYDVPRLQGRTLAEAEAALEETGLALGAPTRAWSETVPEGVVMRSDPEAGTSVPAGRAVDVVVSKGPRPIPVRDWTGRDADRATAALEGKGLVVEVEDELHSDTVPEGHVISQSPATGTLYRKDVVRLVVSLGPELVEVPGGLVASGVDAAREKLEALGFEVRVERSSAYIGLGYVYSTDPDSGDMVPKGSTITLFLV